MNIFKSSCDRAFTTHPKFVYKLPLLSDRCLPSNFYAHSSHHLISHAVSGSRCSLRIPKLAAVTALGTGKRPCRAWRWPIATTILVVQLPLCGALGEVDGGVGFLSSLRVFRDGTLIAFYDLQRRSKRMHAIAFTPWGRGGKHILEFCLLGDGMNWTSIWNSFGEWSSFSCKLFGLSLFCYWASYFDGEYDL